MNMNQIVSTHKLAAAHNLKIEALIRHLENVKILIRITTQRPTQNGNNKLQYNAIDRAT